MHRQHHRHGGTGAGFALDVDGAAVVAHDGVRDGKAQAGAVLLGREEGIEHARQHVRWNAAAVIAHGGDDHARAVATLRARRDGDSVAVATRRRRVEEQIQEDLMDLLRIRRHLRQRFLDIEPDLDVSRRFVELDLRLRTLDGVGDIKSGQLRRTRTRKPEKVVDHRTQPPRLLAQHLEQVVLFRSRRRVVAQNLGGTLNRPERILYLVRQARCHLSQRRQPLAARELALEHGAAFAFAPLTLDQDSRHDADREIEHHLGVLGDQRVMVGDAAQPRIGKGQQRDGERRQESSAHSKPNGGEDDGHVAKTPVDGVNDGAVGRWDQDAIMEGDCRGREGGHDADPPSFQRSSRHVGTIVQVV